MKRIFISIFTFLLLFQANAQERSLRTVYTPFHQSMYVGFNGGLNLFIGEGNNFLQNEKLHIFSLNGNGGFIGRMELGYEITPLWTVRGFVGIAQHNWADTRLPNGDGTYKVHSFGSEQLTADLLFNLTNAWMGYHPDRLLDFSIFGGTGLVMRNKSGFSSSYFSLSARGGAQLDIKLRPDLSLNIIGEANLLGDRFNDYKVTFPIDITAAISVGVSYRLPQMARRDARPVDVRPVIEPKQPAHTTIISQPEPVVAPVIVPVPEPTPEPEPVFAPITPQPVAPQPVAPKPAPVVIEKDAPAAIEKTVARRSRMSVLLYFPKNETAADKDEQKKSVERVAEYLKQNPYTNVSIRGYVEKGTVNGGSVGRMSNYRAEQLSSVLINMFGISRSRISVQSLGISAQKFARPNIDRVVILTVN